MKCVIYNKKEYKSEYYPYVDSVYNGYTIIQLKCGNATLDFNKEEHQLKEVYSE